MNQKIELKKLKLYADGANYDDMMSLAKDQRITGFTTNPTLMRKAGISDYKEFSLSILKEITNRPISLEVFADELDEMKRQALEINGWADNIYVKIPVTNSKGKETTELVRELAHQGVKLNVTAVFTLEQVRKIADALKGGAPSIVSIFAGRIADTGRNPVPLMKEALTICQESDPNIELLWASPRELLNLIEADEMGCHILTATPDILKKLSLLNKDLAEFSLETVQMFKNDAEAAGYTL